MGHVTANVLSAAGIISVVILAALALRSGSDPSFVLMTAFTFIAAILGVNWRRTRRGR